MADDEKTADVPEEESVQEGAAAAPAATQQTLEVDDSDVNASYANFCRVSSTPEELILDLGLNPQPYGSGTTTIKVAQRVILNHYTAKRLLGALSQALQRHEQAFGVLETNVRNRLKAPA
ncbi:MAG: DUF3467 domain-containing protein [Planctomycetaceae bacterium]